MYTIGEVKVSANIYFEVFNSYRNPPQIEWHVPNDQEIGFAVELFDEIVDPALTSLENLLTDSVPRDSDWRNDFCRYLTFVREAFSGIGSLLVEKATQEERDEYYASTDLPYVPRMPGDSIHYISL